LGSVLGAVAMKSVFLVCKVTGNHADSDAVLVAPHDTTDAPILTEEKAKEIADALTLKDGQDRILFKSFARATLKKTVEFEKTNGATILPMGKRT